MVNPVWMRCMNDYCDAGWTLMLNIHILCTHIYIYKCPHNLVIYNNVHSCFLKDIANVFCILLLHIFMYTLCYVYVETFSSLPKLSRSRNASNSMIYLQFLKNLYWIIFRLMYIGLSRLLMPNYNMSINQDRTRSVIFKSILR